MLENRCDVVNVYSFGFNDLVPKRWAQILPFGFEKNVRTSNHASHVQPWAVLGQGRFRGDKVTRKDWDTQQTTTAATSSTFLWGNEKADTSVVIREYIGIIRVSDDYGCQTSHRWCETSWNRPATSARDDGRVNEESREATGVFFHFQVKVRLQLQPLSPKSYWHHWPNTHTRMYTHSQ